jgi:hypothetical protein
MSEEKKKTLREAHREHHEANWSMQTWRAWGSWFSWGSPVGLGIGYALVVVATGLFIWLIRL